MIYLLKDSLHMEDDINIENDSHDLLVVFISVPNRWFTNVMNH